MFEGTDESRRERKVGTVGNETAYVKVLANRYVQQIRTAKRAYEAHRGPKTSSIPYEEPKADTLANLRRLCLDISVDEERIARVVAAHFWESLSESEKGAGKFHRKASTGGWREDLAPKRATLVEEITVPLVWELYS